MHRTTIALLALSFAGCHLLYQSGYFTGEFRGELSDGNIFDDTMAADPLATDVVVSFEKLDDGTFSAKLFDCELAFTKVGTADVESQTNVACHAPADQPVQIVGAKASTNRNGQLLDFVMELEGAKYLTFKGQR